MIIISRIVTALILGLLGYQIGDSADVQRLVPDYVSTTLRFGGLILVGVVTGLFLGGLLGKLLARALEQLNVKLRALTGAELVVGAMGLVVGLAVAFLLSFAIRQLDFIGTYLLLPITLIIAYVFAVIATDKHVEILRLVGVRVEKGAGGLGSAAGKLLDTSALIDGRIGDIVATGFVEGELVVPVFVLEELQHIADSSDDLRRARGRRGLDVVQKLRKAKLLRTPDQDYDDIPAVDSKLVRMAKEHGYVIVTTDFNLNKVAQIQQVKVLNVNELANAIKVEFVPGELFDLKVIREGKEAGQGVGYLEDGTMVIVEAGKDVVGQRVQVEVTSVLQSPTGKLVFTRRVGESAAKSPAASGSRK